jgi:sugar (pentulose or hexulose) kinase
VFEPVAENHGVYDRLYRQVYRRMYKQLQPLYRDIAEITGYPASR